MLKFQENLAKELNSFIKVIPHEFHGNILGKVYPTFKIEIHSEENEKSCEILKKYKVEESKFIYPPDLKENEFFKEEINLDFNNLNKHKRVFKLLKAMIKYDFKINIKLKYSIISGKIRFSNKMKKNLPRTRKTIQKLLELGLIHPNYREDIDYKKFDKFIFWHHNYSIKYSGPLTFNKEELLKIKSFNIIEDCRFSCDRKVYERVLELIDFNINIVHDKYFEYLCSTETYNQKFTDLYNIRNIIPKNASKEYIRKFVIYHIFDNYKGASLMQKYTKPLENILKDPVEVNYRIKLELKEALDSEFYSTKLYKFFPKLFFTEKIHEFVTTSDNMALTTFGWYDHRIYIDYEHLPFSVHYALLYDYSLNLQIEKKYKNPIIRLMRKIPEEKIHRCMKEFLGKLRIINDFKVDKGLDDVKLPFISSSNLEPINYYIIDYYYNKGKKREVYDSEETNSYLIINKLFKEIIIKSIEVKEEVKKIGEEEIVEVQTDEEFCFGYIRTGYSTMKSNVFEGYNFKSIVEFDIPIVLPNNSIPFCFALKLQNSTSEEKINYANLILINTFNILELTKKSKGNCNGLNSSNESILSYAIAFYKRIVNLDCMNEVRNKILYIESIVEIFKNEVDNYTIFVIDNILQRSENEIVYIGEEVELNPANVHFNDEVLKLLKNFCDEN